MLRKDLRTNTTDALNEILIPAQGGPVSGSDYAFIDSTAINGRKYAYMVEDWDLKGVNTIHAPLIAEANPVSPAIRLLAPSDEATLSTFSKFRWQAEGRTTTVQDLLARTVYFETRLLGKDGEFFDMRDAPFRQIPVASDTSDADAKAARAKLQAALDGPLAKGAKSSTPPKKKTKKNATAVAQ